MAYAIRRYSGPFTAASGLDIFAGIWLLISPFVLNFRSNSGMVSNDVICGIAVIILAGVRFFVRNASTVQGETNLESLAALIPAGLPALEPLRTAGTRGDVHFDATITYDREHGLRIPEVNQSARDIAIGGTAMAAADTGGQHA